MKWKSTLTTSLIEIQTTHHIHLRDNPILVLVESLHEEVGWLEYLDEALLGQVPIVPSQTDHPVRWRDQNVLWWWPWSKCCLIGLGKKTDEQIYTYALVLSLSFTVSSIFRTRITCLSPFYWRQYHVPQRFQSIPTKKWTRSHLCPPLVKLTMTKCTIDNIKCDYANALIFRCKSTADLACFKQTDKFFLCHRGVAPHCGGCGGITKNFSWSDRKNRLKLTRAPLKCLHKKIVTLF